MRPAHPEVTPACGEIKRLYVRKSAQNDGVGRPCSASPWTGLPRRVGGCGSGSGPRTSAPSASTPATASARSANTTSPSAPPWTASSS
ncbi:MAG: hypothetical protein WDM92_12020 [Caulobacteraceae bacterium]